MMFYRLPLLTFFVFSIFLASFPAVSAIGISPGMLKIDFEPWLNKTHTYYVRGGGLPIEVYTNPTKCILRRNKVLFRGNQSSRKNRGAWTS
jgi:hypothetical protein